MLSFDDWLKTGNRVPKEQWTFRQYGDYLEGWRLSMPWAYKGMSLDYDNWAESRWKYYPCRESLKTSWKHGMALCAKAWTDGVYQEWKDKPVEDAADLMLITFYGKPKQLTENKNWINILKNRLGNLCHVRKKAALGRNANGRR